MPVLRTTLAVKVLLLTNIAVFLISLIFETFFGGKFLEIFGFIPNYFFNRLYLWQTFTYSFIHTDLFHIVFNLLVIWMIGSELEYQWGTKAFLKYYFFCVFIAALFYLVVVLIGNSSSSYVPMVGSSGGVYGLLVAYGILFSHRQLLFMMIFPMQAKYFVMILAGIEFISTVFYSRSTIASAAHLGGMLAGFLYLVIKARIRIYQKINTLNKQKKIASIEKRIKKSNIRLIINNDTIKDFDSDDSNDDGGNITH
jgi:membrane associated rhomboid family serine protease